MGTLNVDGALAQTIGNFQWWYGTGTTTGADNVYIRFYLPQDPRTPVRYKIIFGSAYNGSTGAVVCRLRQYATYDTSGTALSLELWNESVAANGSSGYIDFSGQLYAYPNQVLQFYIPLAEAAKIAIANLLLEREVVPDW